MQGLSTRSQRPTGTVPTKLKTCGAARGHTSTPSLLHQDGGNRRAEFVSRRQSGVTDIAHDLVYRSRLPPSQRPDDRQHGTYGSGGVVATMDVQPKGRPSVAPDESSAAPAGDSDPPIWRNVESKKCFSAPDM